jgi:hypothetical protein
MLFKPSSLRFSAWLAILVMALNALWPLVAHAKPVGFSPMSEICSTDGLKMVSAPADQAPDDSAAKHLQPHCSLCSFGTDKVSAPPSASLKVPADTLLGYRSIVPESSAEVRSHVRHDARPRAPPSIS